MMNSLLLCIIVELGIIMMLLSMILRRKNGKT